jgi:hypothetical protein
MDRTVLDEIPCTLDLAHLRTRLHVEEGSPDADDLERLVEQAQALARPKALYRLGYIDAKVDDGVVIDGVRLTSRVLRVNLDQAHRVFVYTATCGAELDAWAHALDDVLHQYWAEAFKEAALGAAIKALNADIDERYRPGKTSAMAPGSLVDWPLSQQRPLFDLLGDTHALVGVRLSPSCLMIPNKSISGLRFPTEVSFESCQLCPRPDCPNRRAVYDPALYELKYRAAL